MSCLSNVSCTPTTILVILVIQVILEPSARGLQEMVNKMNDSVKKRGMKVNVCKTKVIVFKKGESTTECDILIEGENIEQVKELGSLFTNYSKHDRDIERGVNAGNKANGALLAFMNIKSVSHDKRAWLSIMGPKPYAYVC
ncbi:hypothetical protein EVAR_10462_1 [Eumeta japonica]|uniref:Reverse transcriptase domain-containing protein n=1 Tax=Eumeta variegata TaxID=151549 RepID=A0A4C1THD3_EUMVA|nr:hypothetical protein EVAR_10462_1 [Eumeta japonica]